MDEKIKRNYKFTIACENATFKGYTSEKLLTAMQAYTVPIYWGDPSVAESLNPKRFINTNCMSLDEVLEKVKQIDTHDDLWCQMVAEPVMTQEQELKYQQEHQTYLDFWDNILTQDLTKAKRLGCGTYPNAYRQFTSNLVAPVFNTKVKKKPSLWNKSETGKSKVVIKILGIKIFSYAKKT